MELGDMYHLRALPSPEVTHRPSTAWFVARTPQTGIWAGKPTG